MHSIRIPAALAAVLCFALASHAADAARAPSPDSSLLLLEQGNNRFANGAPLRPDQTIQRRTEVAHAQHPFAIVLTCADSRVAPELYFDQGLGDLFVLRNAGNVLDDHILGSIEYAVEHLHSGLIVVTGHQRCGAVTAAVEGGHVSGHVASIVATISPHIDSETTASGDAVENAVRAHARATAEAIVRESAVVRERIAAGELKVVAAVYSLDTGRVEILP